ncbi:hypothetical protein MTO96_005275 [Rhipicephalus appendiculatus]
MKKKLVHGACGADRRSKNGRDVTLERGHLRWTPGSRVTNGCRPSVSNWRNRPIILPTQFFITAHIRRSTAVLDTCQQYPTRFAYGSPLHISTHTFFALGRHLARVQAEEGLSELREAHVCGISNQNRAEREG